MGFRTARERLEYEKWAEQDRQEQAAIAERLERPIKEAELKREIARNAGKLFQIQRRLTLGYEERPYVSPEIRNMTFNDEQELENFLRQETRAFIAENPDWQNYNSPENIATLVAIYQNRGITVIDRAMLRSGFLSLIRDGLLEPNAAPTRELVPVAIAPSAEDFSNLPRLHLGHSVPAAWKRESTQETHQGIDPDTGKQREYTQLEVDLMPADLFKKVFNVPTPALTRVNFLR